MTAHRDALRFPSATLTDDDVAREFARAWRGPFRHEYDAPPGSGRSAAWRRHNDARRTAAPLAASPDWRCESLKDAYEQYFWVSASYEPPENATSLLRAVVRRGGALTGVDRMQIEKACLEIFSWGGVARAPRDASRIFLQASDSGRRIASAVEQLRSSAGPPEVFGVSSPMNSAMAKIYALADPEESLPIYDSRVGAAMGLFALRAWRARGTPAFPETLKFAWGPKQSKFPDQRSSRDPSCAGVRFPNLFANPGKDARHAACMWRAARIIGRAAQLLSSPAETIKVRQLEKALFMIGYDLRRARCAGMTGTSASATSPP